MGEVPWYPQMTLHTWNVLSSSTGLWAPGQWVIHLPSPPHDPDEDITPSANTPRPLGEDCSLRKHPMTQRGDPSLPSGMWEITALLLLHLLLTLPIRSVRSCETQTGKITTYFKFIIQLALTDNLPGCTGAFLACSGTRQKEQPLPP
jgi:hypothetical protein